jgi:peptide/nickel transport system permease protein
MTRYLLRKLILLVPTVIGATLVVFIAVRVIPGDPAQMMLGDRATGEELARLRQELGLNDRLDVQYARFFVQSLHGDFGRSLRVQDSAINVIWSALPTTIELTIASLVVACIVGLTAGVLSAVRQYGVFDTLVSTLVLVGVSMPAFWSGLLLILVFGLQLHLFPIGGALSDGITLQRRTGMYVVDGLLQGNWVAIRDATMHLILPTLTLATLPIAVITRMTRASVLEVLRQEYVTTARSKGLSERVVVLRHALKNAAIPIVTAVGLQLGYLLSGAVVTETVFARPGLGRLAVTSIQYRDYPVVEGIVLLSVAIFITVNLAVDLVYGYLNPRIKYG